MDRRTQLIIGLVVVVIGVGVVSLGFFEEGSDVRYVKDIQADPEAHQSGSYTLLGYPQPPTIPLAGSDGSSEEVPNPEYRNETRTVSAWNRDGTLYHSTHTLSVVGPDEDGISTWTLRNETRQAGRAELAFPAQTTSWTMEGPHMVFLIQGFVDENGDVPFLFGVYEGVLREPMQPKPSQFKGRLMDALPDGSALPAGALVYDVEEYTAGCSSKLLPPEAQEEDHTQYANSTSAAEEDYS